MFFYSKANIIIYLPELLLCGHILMTYPHHDQTVPTGIPTGYS